MDLSCSRLRAALLDVKDACARELERPCRALGQVDVGRRAQFVQPPQAAHNVRLGPLARGLRVLEDQVAQRPLQDPPQLHAPLICLYQQPGL